MTHVQLASSLDEVECRRRLLGSFDGRMRWRWLTWSDAYPRTRLMGRCDGDLIRVSVVGPASPKALCRLPKMVRALPVFQSGIQVLTLRFVDDPRGTSIHGEVTQPVGDSFLMATAVCGVLAILDANPLWLIGTPVATGLILLANVVFLRRRLAANRTALLQRVKATLANELERNDAVASSSREATA